MIECFPFFNLPVFFRYATKLKKWHRQICLLLEDLKLLVEEVVFISLFEQNLVMKGFIGLGWLSILIMVASIVMS